MNVASIAGCDCCTPTNSFIRSRKLKNTNNISRPTLTKHYLILTSNNTLTPNAYQNMPSPKKSQAHVSFSIPHPHPNSRFSKRTLSPTSGRRIIRRNSVLRDAHLYSTEPEPAAENNMDPRDHKTTAVGVESRVNDAAIIAALGIGPDDYDAGGHYIC